MTTSKARRNRVKELWSGLPESWRTQLASAVNTFLATFAVSIGVFLTSTEGTTWTKETLLAASIAAVVAAVRAGVKAVLTAFFTRVLPDPKKS